MNFIQQNIKMNIISRFQYQTLKPQYQILKPQYEKEIEAALIGGENNRNHANEELRPSDNTKQPHSGRRGQNIASPNSKKINVYLFEVLCLIYV